MERCTRRSNRTNGTNRCVVSVGSATHSLHTGLYDGDSNLNEVIPHGLLQGPYKNNEPSTDSLLLARREQHY